MMTATREWIEGLRDFAADSARGAAQVPHGTAAATAAERAILAAHLATWLDAIPTLLEERRAFARSIGPHADTEAAIVITTSAAGIAVAEEILARDEPLARDVRPRIACTTEAHYRAWCIRHPDEGHLRHVNHWSWIKMEVPRQRHAEFARHPLGPGERYWLHRTGTTGAGAADGRSAHLWKFTGLHAVLLQAFIVEGRVASPGA